MKKLYGLAIGILLFLNVNNSFSQIADLGVVGINSPLSPMCASKPTLVVTLFNYASVDHYFAADRAIISVSVTGASTQNFNFSINSGTLTAGSSAQYVVANPVDLTVVGTHHFDATVSIVTGDADSTNNALPTIDIIVNPLPAVTLDSLLPVCLNTPLFSLTAGNPIGGTYSGVGVSAGMFDPVAAGAGTKSITYTYTDTNGCSAFKSRYINVYTPPSVTHTSLTAICSTATAFTLTGGTPAGGTYSGTGVSGGVFTPSVSGIGNFNIEYVYIDGNGCSDTAFLNQQVYASPPVVFSSITPVCINGSAITLSGGSPTGGTYSGSGVSSGTFDPLLTGAGTFSLTYVYTDGSGCTDSAIQTIDVRNLPTVAHSSPTNTCQNSGTIVLSGGSPAGGIYRGAGAFGDSTFTPSIPGVGTCTLSYIYTDSIGCTDSVYTTITINAPPVVMLASLSNVCITSPAFTLSGGSPTGGNYFGTGITTGTFTPSAAGAGTHTVYYTYTDPATTCSDTASKAITVVPFPSANIGDTTHCAGNPLVLNAGNPGAGYLWSTGATTQTISLTGSDTVSVTISYGSGCVATHTAIATFVAPPTPYIGEDIDACENSTVVLSVCAGGYSAYTWCNGGGTLCSITALNSGTYCVTVTDANGCTATDSINVTLNPLPAVSFSLTTTFICLNAPSFTLTGGSPAGGLYSGTGVSAGMFDPAVAGAGTHIVTYSYTDTTTGCTNNATQMITVGCVGLNDEIANSNFVKLFPNPANTKVSIVHEREVSDELIVVMDLQGKKVYEQYINVANKGDVININTGDFANGVYIVQLLTTQSSTAQKLIVSH